MDVSVQCDHLTSDEHPILRVEPSCDLEECSPELLLGDNVAIKIDDVVGEPWLL